MTGALSRAQIDWSAGIPACMSVASTRKGLRISTFDAAEAATLQAGMPALQSVELHQLSFSRKRILIRTGVSTSCRSSN